MVKQQHITDDFALYNSDCMYVLPTLPDKSIDLSVYSPPFCGLYNYSSSENDMSNCDSYEAFSDQYEYLVKEIARVTKPGRITAVHCQDVLMNVTENHLYDFPHEIIRLHLKHGFHFVNRITIWKEPLKVRIRTMVRSLMHKLIVEDSAGCFTAQPDYVLLFKKAGKNQVPVTHPQGLKRYAGAIPLLPEMEKRYGPWEHIKAKYADWKDQRTNKMSHIIWQRYASAVWDDIRNDHTLSYKEAREDDDEKHVHPLQLDVIDRLVDLYSNPGETVLTPFMGVGSEVYSPVSMGRKAIGIELKDSYYKQALRNLETVKERFLHEREPELDFTSIEEAAETETADAQ
jgi:DNA modification methylase